MEYELGSIYDGKITKIAAFGAFVALDGGGVGMIHISEISRGFVRDIREHLTEGQQVRVKLIKIDEVGRLSLSLRQVEDREAIKAPPIQYSVPDSAHGSARETSSDFEDMMSRFKALSDDKLSDQKRRAKRRE